MNAIRQQTRRTIQSQVRDDRELGIGLLFNLAKAGELLPPWWSQQRDIELTKFALQSDHFQSAEFMISAKLTSVPFRVEARDRSVKRHQRLADEYQAVLVNMLQFGQGWQALWDRFLSDLWRTDNGAFAEILGPGNPGGPRRGPAISIEHLDSLRCTRTSNPEYPVTYQDVSGKRFKLHHTRVIYASQRSSARVDKLGVGHCWLSRAINNVQQLVDQDVYFQEALGSRPIRQMMLGRGIDTDDMVESVRRAEDGMDNQGLSRYSKTVFVGDSHLTDIGIDTIPFTFLPDGYDKQQQTSLAMFLISLAGGFPPRWLWPATQAGATKADAMYQHISGSGAGALWHLNMMRDLLSYTDRSLAISNILPPKFLPKELRLVFDYQDDEQDNQQADIRDKRANTRKTDLEDGVITIRVAREQALAAGDITQAQFNQMELGDGRLPAGTSVLSLFDSTDPLIVEMLDLGVEEPLLIDANDPIEMMIAIESAALAAQARMVQARSAAERDKAEQALEALGALKGIYEEIVGKEIEEEIAAEQAAGEFELPEVAAETPGESQATETPEEEAELEKAFNYGAKFGERIRGGLFRGRGGKFASEAELGAVKSEILARLIARLRAARAGGTGKGGAAKKPKKGGGGGGGKKKPSAEEAARQKRAKQQAAMNEVFGVRGKLADKMGMARNDIFALEKAVLDDEPMSKEDAARFTALGLVKFSDGEPIVTPAGRALITAAAAGNVGRASAALTRGKEAVKKVQARAAKKRERAEAARERGAELTERAEAVNADADELSDDADELLAQAGAEEDEKKAERLRDRAARLQERAEKKREQAAKLEKRAAEQVERATDLDAEAGEIESTISGEGAAQDNEPPTENEQPETREPTDADVETLAEVADNLGNASVEQLRGLVAAGLIDLGNIPGQVAPRLTAAGRAVLGKTKATNPEEPPRGDFEEQITGSLEPVFKRAQVQTLDALQRGVDPDDTELRQELISLFVPILTDAALYKFNLFEDQFSLSFDAGETQAEAERWARQHASSMVDGLINTTENIVNGIDQDATQEEIEATVDRAFNEDRRERIGITETTVALMFGAMLYQRFIGREGVEIELRWFTRQDERVCPICAPLHGTKQEVWSQEFPDGPPAHVRCRCDVVATRKRG